MQSLFSLAETCQQHLAVATRRNCPSRRYSIILEELRQEVHRQLGSFDPSGFGQMPALREHDRYLGQETSTMDRVDGSDGFESQGLGFSPVLGALQPTDLSVMNPDEDMGPLENLEGSIWWAQLDSWVCRLAGLAPCLYHVLIDPCRLCPVSLMIHLHSHLRESRPL